MRTLAADMVKTGAAADSEMGARLSSLGAGGLIDQRRTPQ
jgi:hypothetical protein